MVVTRRAGSRHGMNKWAGGLYWAYSVPAYCGLIAMLPDGRAMVRHELTWHRVTEHQAVSELTAFLKTRKIALSYLVAQPQIFPQEKHSGPTVSEAWQRGPWALYRGHKDLAAGWHRLRAWFDPAQPYLTTHTDCAKLLRTLPTLVSDKQKPDEVDLTPDAYPALALAQWAMSRPTAGTVPEPEPSKDSLYYDIQEIRRDNELALRYS